MKDKTIFVCFAASMLCAVTECCLGWHKLLPTAILQTFSDLKEKYKWIYPGRSSLLIKKTHVYKGR